MVCRYITLFVCAVLPFVSCATERTKPNIILFLVDDLGWSDLGCYGNTFNQTPNIDRLASEGMRFTNAYAAAPVCSPTRASIMSGQYPARIGITDFIRGHWKPHEKLRVPINRTQYLPLEVKTVAEALKPAGYVSGHFGKWHLGENGHLPSDQGFEDALVSHGGAHFLPRVKTTPPLDVADGAYLAEILTDRAIAFIEENRDRAFFLHLSHYAVHIPLEARQELIAKYQSREKTPGRINNPIYAAMLEHVDQSLGRVLHKLDELNLSQDTILVFFSDNGGLTRKFDGKGVDVTTNDPLRDEKGTLYEGGIRVPMIVRWTGSIQSGTLCEIPVSSVDFYPTFLDLADQPIPHQQLDGESLVSLLRQSGGLSRDALYWHYPHYHHSTPASAIRVADWKLIEFFEDGRVELYDLSNDIGESKNLAQEEPERVKKLSTRLDQWRRSVEAALPVLNPDFDPARRDSFGRVPRN